MRPLLIVLRKELRENLRDRRTFMSALLIGAVLMPLLMGLLVNLTVRRGQSQDNQPVNLAVVHAERAPGLVAQLRQYRIDVSRVALEDAAARDAVRQQRRRIVLAIPDNYASQLAQGLPAPVLLYSDSSDVAGSSDVARCARRPRPAVLADRAPAAHGPGRGPDRTVRHCRTGGRCRHADQPLGADPGHSHLHHPADHADGRPARDPGRHRG